MTRAVVCTALTGEDGLVFEGRPEPGPIGPNQVRIAVEAASVRFPTSDGRRERGRRRCQEPTVKVIAGDFASHGREMKSSNG